MRCILLAVLLFAAALPSDARAEDAGVQSAAQCRPPFDVGFRIVQIPGGPLTAVWYPSANREDRFPYSDALAGSVARDGRPRPAAGFPSWSFPMDWAAAGRRRSS